VLLGALNRYRIVPALAGGVRRLDGLRRNVRGEVVLAACILAVTAVLSQLPPGKFVVEQAAAKPPAPPSVQVEGSDFATSVRVALSVSPGTPGPNAFTAKVTDYDTGKPYPAQRVALRFTQRDRPEVSGATLDLARDNDGSWQAKGSQLSIDGRWVITALVQGPGTALTVPLELRTRTAKPRVTVSRAPGQPDLYTISLPTGGSVQAYLDPGRPGPNTAHFTFFTASGSEQPIDEAHATMTTPLGQTQTIDLQVLSAGHFAANLDLQSGAAAFTIHATPHEGQPVTASFSQQVK
jgi:nitrogen fixation protein FixH